METDITSLKGNGIHNLANSTRSRLHLVRIEVAAINTDKIV